MADGDGFFELPSGTTPNLLLAFQRSHFLCLLYYINVFDYYFTICNRMITFYYFTIVLNASTKSPILTSFCYISTG